MIDMQQHVTGSDASRRDVNAPLSVNSVRPRARQWGRPDPRPSRERLAVACAALVVAVLRGRTFSRLRAPLSADAAPRPSPPTPGTPLTRDPRRDAPVSGDRSPASVRGAPSGRGLRRRVQDLLPCVQGEFQRGGGPKQGVRRNASRRKDAGNAPQSCLHGPLSKVTFACSSRFPKGESSDGSSWSKLRSNARATSPFARLRIRDDGLAQGAAIIRAASKKRSDKLF